MILELLKFGFDTWAGSRYSPASHLRRLPMGGRTRKSDKQLRAKHLDGSGEGMQRTPLAGQTLGRDGRPPAAETGRIAAEAPP
jgi:hypothetical protein